MYSAFKLEQLRMPQHETVGARSAPPGVASSTPITWCRRHCDVRSWINQTRRPNTYERSSLSSSSGRPGPAHEPGAAPGSSRLIRAPTATVALPGSGGPRGPQAGPGAGH